MEIWCLSFTTNVAIPLVIYLIFSMISFYSRSQLSIKLFYIMNIVGLIYMLIRCNLIYIHNEISVSSVNREANLLIDLKNLILINILLGFIDF